MQSSLKLSNYTEHIQLRSLVPSPYPVHNSTASDQGGNTLEYFVENDPIGYGIPLSNHANAQ